jgi:hypothetical protein
MVMVAVEVEQEAAAVAAVKRVGVVEARWVVATAVVAKRAVARVAAADALAGSAAALVATAGTQCSIHRTDFGRHRFPRHASLH